MSTLRQLAAIVFVDIEGFTALMQTNEFLAMQWRERLKQKLQEETEKHFGKILDFRGDGALCSFTSTTEAVLAAIAVQIEMQKEPAVPVRFGLHTGDVVVNENSIYGDGVNMASRIESFAIPGSIFISGKVYDDIKNQKQIQSVSLGKFALKNVAEQVEIHAISNPGIKIPGMINLVGKGEKIQANQVLVLPFVNMSNDPGQEYFSDGLTEEIISCLSQIHEIKVISRTTSMKYKGSKESLKNIGRETGATYVLEGSVRKAADLLRITAQFVDAHRDTYLWTETYRGTLDDIFDIQENVSARIAEALRIRLTKNEKDSLRKRYTDDSEAYQLYLQGRFFLKKRNAAGMKSAIRHFEKAIEKDPDYALAWAGLADTYSLMGEYTNISRRELLPKQVEALNKALEIDDRLGEVHISKATALMLNDWDWVNAEKEFKLGIELSPHYAAGHHWYAEWLLYSGFPDAAFEEISLAYRLEPASQVIVKDLGMYYYYTRQYEKAVEMAFIALELDPGFVSSYRLLSLAYLALGNTEKALESNQQWGEKSLNWIKTELGLAYILAYTGQMEDARKILERKGLENDLGHNDCRGLALVYAALGDVDQAFQWLEQGINRHEESLTSIQTDPKFDPLRKDPRYTEVLKKIGLYR